MKNVFGLVATILFFGTLASGLVVLVAYDEPRSGDGVIGFWKGVAAAFALACVATTAYWAGLPG